MSDDLKPMRGARSTSEEIRTRSIAFLAAAACAAAPPAVAAPFDGGPGPDVLVGAIPNDRFRGLGGDDTLVGDFFAVTAEDLSIRCSAGAGVEQQPIDGANAVTTDLANDLFADGPGDDFVIGDAGVTHDFDEFQIFAVSGTGAIGGGAGGDFNIARCYSDSSAFELGEDSFFGGPGNDIFVGDAFHANVQPEDLNIDAGAGSAAMGQYAFFPYGPGGSGGDNNTLQAFDDAADFTRSFSGTKLLVGDAYSKAPVGAEDHLIASAGSGGRSGGSGGNTNTVSAYNDALRGSPRLNQIFGDDYRNGGTGDLLLVASAGAGGENPGGGSGGANNVLLAFSDSLFGDFAPDFIIGDAYLSGGPTDELKFVVYAGFTQPGGGAGNFGNQLAAFNDAITGGSGGDIIIGEGQNVGDTEGVRFVVGVDGGNTASAFSDQIDAGPGNDRIHGDLRYAGDVCNIDEFDVRIAVSGLAQLFADTIDAGYGADRIHGGFGRDTMTGGNGRDTYLYYEPDLLSLTGAGGPPPVDVIIGFDASPFGDVIDLKPLLNCLGFDPGDNPNQWLRVLGSNLEIDIDGPVGGFTPTPFISAVELLGRTVDQLVAGPVGARNLLVP